MVQSRRNSLKSIKKAHASHAGLWLDKYLPYQITKGSKVSEERTPQATLVSEVATVKIPESYKHFYRRWQKDLQDYQVVFGDDSEVHTFGAVCRKATVQGRMAVGLGDEGVLETSVTLHRTYGVPYIPGSALKGLTASYVRQRMDNPQWGSWEGEKGEDENHKKKKWVPGAAYQIMFGDTENAGYLTFFDALYVPDRDDNKKPLQPDVMTVHHQGYYGSKDGEEVPPADWDSPVPVPFLSATGTYLIAIAGPEPFVSMAFGVLAHALAEVGIGAKTSSGYGRMKLEEEPAEPRDPEQEIVNELLQRLNMLSVKNVAGEISKFAKEWQDLQVSLLLKRKVAQAIIDKVREADREKKSANKGWYQALLACLEENVTL